jgi:YVTN family beta-propeller protein
MILGIMVLENLAIVSNNSFGQQDLHGQTLYEVVNSESNENVQIDVDNFPDAIAINQDTNTIYVANRDSNTVSVISAENNTKITDISVRKSPSAIDINQDTNTIYVANAGSNTVSVISGENNTIIKDIPVGYYPRDIGVDESLGIVYVANLYSNTVSAIFAENNTKIGEEGEDIPVGDFPAAIGVHKFLGTVYVANSGSNTVSVISGEDHTKITTIPVGDSPTDIGVLDILYSNNPHDITSTINITNVSDRVYVANRGSNTVSVISAENNTKIGEDIPVGHYPAAVGVLNDEILINIQEDIPSTVYVANFYSNTVSVISAENNTKIGEDIPVGNKPSAIDINQYTNATYVANSDSDGVSVIDARANKVVAGITFQVDPFNAGYIVCRRNSDGLTTTSPIGQYTFVYPGDKCTAKPNKGFEFSSWEENLGGNATRLVNVSRPASSLDSFLEFLGIKSSSDKPEAKLDITKFGTFTANFRKLPPAFPPEYLIPLYGIIASTIIGWSIPSIIGWARSKRDVGKLNYFHKQIASLYGDGKLDEDDIEPLDKLRSSVIDAYSEGKINEKHYESLRNEISTLYEKIFRKKIGDLLDNSNSSSATKKLRQEQLTQIRNEVEYAYSEGKISEKHYDLLNKAISNLESKEE